MEPLNKYHCSQKHWEGRPVPWMGTLAGSVITGEILGTQDSLETKTLSSFALRFYLDEWWVVASFPTQPVVVSKVVTLEKAGAHKILPTPSRRSR
jgi:hypothetical protein